MARTQRRLLEIHEHVLHLMIPGIAFANDLPAAAGAFQHQENGLLFVRSRKQTRASRAP